MNSSLSYSRRPGVPSWPLSVLVLNVLLFTNPKKKNWFKEAFPTDAKSMKLLPSGPPHFLLWLPYLSFFSYKPQQRQESFLPEAISMLHHCALLSRRELISLTSNSTQGHSPGLLTSSAAKEEPRLASSPASTVHNQVQEMFPPGGRVVILSLTMPGPLAPAAYGSQDSLFLVNLQEYRAGRLGKPNPCGPLGEDCGRTLVPPLNETAVTSATTLCFQRDMFCLQV